MRALHRRIAAATLTITSISCAVPPRAQAQQLPPGFVHLREIAPSIIEDIRYATPHNFTGAVVPGYAAAACILRREVALALEQVQQDLRQQGLGLKVFDCYRPQQAVRALVAWAKRPQGPTFGMQNPRVPRNALISSGYISTVSHHALGIAVDLTLVRLPYSPTAQAQLSGPCTAPITERQPDGGLDMGTSFDCFDPASAPRSRHVEPDQRANRKLLVDAMAARGFRGLSTEWWHFTYRNALSSAGPRDFPVVAPAKPN